MQGWVKSSLLQVHLLVGVDGLWPRGEGREGWLIDTKLSVRIT